MWTRAFVALLALTTLAFGQHVSDSCVLTLSGYTGKLVPSAGTYLLKFVVQFDGNYPNVNPLSGNESGAYRPNEWSLVVTKHGETLLNLQFDYDILSLSTLSFGVKTISNLLVSDNPYGCLGKLPYSDRLQEMMYLLTNDSLKEGLLPKGQSLCYEVIEPNNGYGTFVYKCCHPDQSGFTCADLTYNSWINILYGLVGASKILFLLLGPLLLAAWFFSQSITKTDYLVTLPSPLKRTLLIKKASPDTSVQETQIFDETDIFFPGYFNKFKALSQVLPSDKVLRTEVDRIHLQVDHSYLLDDQSVPFGLLLFLWQNVFQCGLMRYEPFRSCCTQSIIGSWDTRFLCIPLGNRASAWNNKCKRYLSYGNITGLIAGLILVFAVPLPYYARLAIYYYFEHGEVTSRHNAVRNLGLKEPITMEILQYLTPIHPFLIFVYVMYFIASVSLAMFQKWQRKTFQIIVLGSLQDLRKLSRGETIRLILSHLLLPFEKFGICCGAIVAVLYYPFALSLCVLTAVFYMVPTVYMIGRLILQARPWVIRKIRVPYVNKSSSDANPQVAYKLPLDLLSLGVTSIESCMMLNNISPPTLDQGVRSGQREWTRVYLIRELCKSFVGVLCVLWMLSVLLMYAECVGFLLEVSIMVLMGAVVNAGSAANYVMVVFWCLMYSINCYNSAYKTYLALHKKVFDTIKAKLSDSTKKGTRQHFRGYKYFSVEELKGKKQAEMDSEFNSEAEASPVAGNAEHHIAVQDRYEDKFEYINGRLYWRMRSLVLFVDRHGTPRIPLTLFHMACEFRGSGCPGPIYKGLLDATKQFVYMVIFLVFVILVVFAFDNVKEMSTTNQLVVTLAGGLIPFVVRNVLDPNQGSLQLEESGFQAMLSDLLRRFVQVWPVHDLTFRVDGGEEEKDPCPRQIDLVLSVKDIDDMDDANTDGKPVEVKLHMKVSELFTTFSIQDDPDGRRLQTTEGL